MLFLLSSTLFQVPYMQIRENNWTINADSFGRWNLRYDLWEWQDLCVVASNFSQRVPFWEVDTKVIFHGKMIHDEEHWNYGNITILQNMIFTWYTGVWWMKFSVTPLHTFSLVPTLCSHISIYSQNTVTCNNPGPIAIIQWHENSKTHFQHLQENSCFEWHLLLGSCISAMFPIKLKGDEWIPHFRELVYP